MSDKSESFENWRKGYWSRKGVSADTTHRFLMAEALDAWNHQEKKLQAEREKVARAIAVVEREIEEYGNSSELVELIKLLKGKE